MNKAIELGINPAEFARNQEREIMDQASAERMAMLGNVVNGVSKGLLVAARHSWGVGSVVEGAELYRDKNFLTGKRLTTSERRLRYVGVCFEAGAFALAIAAGYEELGKILQAIPQSLAQHQLHDLYAALSQAKHVLNKPEIYGAAAMEIVSAHSGYAQEVVTMAHALKLAGDKVGISKLAEALNKMFEIVKMAKPPYGN